ncbi:hypothetical protein SARC_08532 [Sphaeroforma arctica JP610]|uniref:Uncharacterized protein n=1 Tax=Sphaeroforma arctica JP610 TaxID=667725 RepID=A0A0L0FQM7_9EUKA|nr:hypothetical protein SARC_08532 [Sphaeroforma arctica JP610]KNC79065.1 hypothetical protein SARC_08532 [Sphaeroforma arctica JP610]|eukprot:XP_014152967.1 hypothetical protein SARC_08532 [Sphaeroforma arctica JP610]
MGCGILQQCLLHFGNEAKQVLKLVGTGELCLPAEDFVGRPMGKAVIYKYLCPKVNTLNGTKVYQDLMGNRNGRAISAKSSITDNGTKVYSDFKQSRMIVLPQAEHSERSWIGKRCGRPLRQRWRCYSTGSVSSSTLDKA